MRAIEGKGGREGSVDSCDTATNDLTPKRKNRFPEKKRRKACSIFEAVHPHPGGSFRFP